LREGEADKVSNRRVPTPEARVSRSQSVKRTSLFPTPARSALIAGALVLVVILVCDLVRDAVRSDPGDLVSSGALKIDINTAGKEDLMLLPGVGPALADAILEERRAGGGFARLDDLARVDGISVRTVDRLRRFAVCSSSGDAPAP